MPAPQIVIDFVEEIDTNFIRANANRVSRMDITWGKWSRDINLRMRELQKTSTDPLKSLLVWTFMYWMNRSQLLELNFKHRLTKPRRRRELVVEGQNIKRIILSGDPIGPPEQAAQINKLLQRVEDSFKK